MGVLGVEGNELPIFRLRSAEPSLTSPAPLSFLPQTEMSTIDQTGVQNYTDTASA